MLKEDGRLSDILGVNDYFFLEKTVEQKQTYPSSLTSKLFFGSRLH